MKSVFIIHSWNGNTINSFAPYIEEICKNNNIDYYYPNFPTGENANYESWKEVMDYYKDNNLLNENSMIISHSMGTHFIPKYLNECNLKINTYVAVAASTKFIENEKLLEKVKLFLPTTKELIKLKDLVKTRYSIYSNNDSICIYEGLLEYSSLIDSNKIEIKGYGHFGPKSGVKEVKEINKLVEKYIKEK